MVVRGNYTSDENLVCLPKRIGWLIKECLFVGCNKRVFDRGQDTNLVERILLLPVGQVLNLDFLEGVELGVLLSLHLVHA
jgi:hypothetical protein